MVFTKPDYFIILLFTLIIFYLLPRKLRLHVLTFSGLFFYAYFAGSFVYILVAELIIVYVLLKRVRRKIYFAAAVILPVLVLGYYKYRFLLDSPAYISWFDYVTSNIIIPLGLSFLTFEIIHYAVDLRNGKIKVHGFAAFMAFVMFFPSFAAGPIKRFQKFYRRPASAKLNANNIFTGSVRIIFGLFKKIVIADSLSPLRSSLTNPAIFLGNDPVSLWISIFAFSLEIYFDFSAYSDIAIGSAKLFGITIPENFNNPYFKTNVRSFWKNWHISLYMWIVDYIFVPLGGNRVSKAKLFRNIFIVFLIIGIWHGASLNFILWGIYHGFLISLYYLYCFYIKPSVQNSSHYTSVCMKAASILATFVLVSIGWIFFVLSDVTAIILVLKQILFLGGIV